MKKLFAKIISLATAVMLCLFAFSGCELISTNVERDMDQDIVTVAVDSELSETIKKKELVSAFNSQGYYYVQYMGYTESQAYEMILENLVQSRIIVQQAKIALTGATSLNSTGYFAQAAGVEEAKRTDKEKLLTTPNWETEPKAMTTLTKTSSLESFMTEYEYWYARYSVLTQVRSLIDGYKDEVEEHNHTNESYSGTVRATLTAPSEEAFDEVLMRYDSELKVINPDTSFYKTLANVNEKSELGIDFNAILQDATKTNYDLALTVYKTYCEKFSAVSKEDKRAVNKLIKDLKDFGFVTSAELPKKSPETASEFLAISFFKTALKGQYENIITEKYELALQNEQEKKIDVISEENAGESELYKAYANIFNTQKAIYATDYTAYESALSTASESNLVLYNPNYKDGKYGYVVNLLIGFNEAQTAMLEAYKTDNPKLTDKQLEDARNSLLATLTAKDLRASWVESNYGEYKDGVITFNDKYVKTDALKTFAGKVYGASKYEKEDGYGNHIDAYSFDSVIANEIPFSEFYAMLSSAMGFNDSGKLENATKEGNPNLIKDEILEKYRDYVYAYSTDDGSLKENYGYLYSPKTSSTQYVKEFAEAAKRVVDKGVGAYEVVATDYGYHIILCSKVVEPSETIISPEDFKDLLDDKGSIPYMFKEYQKDRIVVDNVTKITDSFINANKENCVTFYEENYADLIPQEE